ncbi:hypothetical protein lbkm_2158 [Lachnospiraceae bacterium KM106-2]|nr:hypothetical protein lbkm_2158 [Lachnospiraceae bacterium KM106-2]
MRKQTNKMAAFCLIATIVLMGVQVPVMAMGTSMTQEQNSNLQSGKYTADIEIYKVDTDVSSMAGNFMDKQNLTVLIENGTATLRLSYTSPMITKLMQKVNGVETPLAVSEENGKKYVNLSLTSFDEPAYLVMQVNTGAAGVMTHTVRVIVKADTLQADDGRLKDGVYEVNSYFWHASMNQSSMAGTSLEEKARISVKDGVARMYLYTTKMQLGTITAYLQEMQVIQADQSYVDAVVEAKDANGNPNCFSITLPSYDEFIKIKVNPHVAIMGNQFIDARLKIDYTSLMKVEGEVNLTQSPLSIGGSQEDNNDVVTPTPVVEATPAPTKAPSATKVPAATKIPVATKVPAATKVPSVTKAPSATKVPSATKTPAVVNNSTSVNSDTDSSTNTTVTEQTEATKAPEATQVPAATEEKSSTTEEKKEEATQEEAQEETSPTTKPVSQTKKETTKSSRGLQAAAAVSGTTFIGIALWTSRLKLLALIKR